jgi:hypothetical protein
VRLEELDCVQNAFGAVTRHEVETSHKEDHVGEKEPMLLQRNFALSQESTTNVRTSFAHLLSLNICLSLGQAKSEEDDENWRASAEPEQLAVSLV